MTFLHHVGEVTKAPDTTTKSIKGADFQGRPFGEDFVDFAVDSLRVIHARLRGGQFESHPCTTPHGGGGGGSLCKVDCSDNSLVDADFCCLNSV